MDFKWYLLSWYIYLFRGYRLLISHKVISHATENINLSSLNRRPQWYDSSTSFEILWRAFFLPEMLIISLIIISIHFFSIPSMKYGLIHRLRIIELPSHIIVQFRFQSNDVLYLMITFLSIPSSDSDPVICRSYKMLSLIILVFVF